MHVITVWVFNHDWAGHDGVSHTILVLSTDSELILVALDKFLHITVGGVAMDVGADQRPVGPAGLSLVDDVVGDLRTTISQGRVPAEPHMVRKHLADLHRGGRTWFV